VIVLPVRTVERGFAKVLFFLSAMFCVHISSAAELVDTIKLVRPSIVAVGTFKPTANPQFTFRGTGFAVGDGSLVVTNAHVLPNSVDLDAYESVAIAIPGDDAPGASGRKAQVVATSPEHDLALLKFAGPPLKPLGLAEDALVEEGERVAFTGFPIGSVLGLIPVTHRGIVSAVTPIVMPGRNARELNPRNIRSLKDPFRVYQLDATAYPGNSGSPLYDPDSGAVIGVINMVLVKATKESALSQPSGISYAIPSRYIHDLLRR